MLLNFFKLRGLNHVVFLMFILKKGGVEMWRKMLKKSRVSFKIKSIQIIL